jgi:hypothetical protein
MGLMLRAIQYFMVLCVISSAAFPQSHTTNNSLPPDSTLAKNEVTKFCKFWKTPQLDSMRSMLGKGARPDSLFLKTYGMNGKGPGKVVKFSIVDAAQNEKGVKVRVNCTARIAGDYKLYYFLSNGRIPDTCGGVLQIDV